MNHHRLYFSKIIKIISPYTGQSFNVDLNSEENELRELLGIIIGVSPQSIKGLKDSYSNYYTLSSALKNPNLNFNPNNYFTVVTKENELKKKLNAYDFGGGIHEYKFSKIDIQNYYYNYKAKSNKNIRRNYCQKDFKSLADSLFTNHYIDYGGVYILRKLINNNNREILSIMEPYIKYNKNYTELINKLIPNINRYLTIDKKESLNNYNTYRQALDNVKENFTNSQMKYLESLLLMENIDIIYILKCHNKDRDSKELTRNLIELLKKHKSKYNNSNSISINDFDDLNVENTLSEEELINDNNNYNNLKNDRKRKSKSQNYKNLKISRPSEKELKNIKKEEKIRGISKNINCKNTGENNIIGNKGKSSKKNITIGKKELLQSIAKAIIQSFGGKKNDIYYIIKYDMEKLSNKEKEKLINKKFRLSNDKLSKKNIKEIKNYYKGYIDDNIINTFDETEIKVYNKLNENNDKDLIKCYKELIKNKKLDKLKNKLKEIIKEKIGAKDERDIENSGEKEEDDTDERKIEEIVKKIDTNKTIKEDENGENEESEKEEDGGQETTPKIGGSSASSIRTGSMGSSEEDDSSNVSICKRDKPSRKKKEKQKEPMMDFESEDN